MHMDCSFQHCVRMTIHLPGWSVQCAVCTSNPDSVFKRLQAVLEAACVPDAERIDVHVIMVTHCEP
jgi:hypothetical protein